MSTTAVISIEIDAETLILLDKVAAARELDRDVLVARMIRKQVRDEAAFIDFVQEGEDAIARGDYLTHEELVARLKGRAQAKRAA